MENLTMESVKEALSDILENGILNQLEPPWNDGEVNVDQWQDDMVTIELGEFFIEMSVRAWTDSGERIL